MKESPKESFTNPERSRWIDPGQIPEANPWRNREIFTKEIPGGITEKLAGGIPEKISESMKRNP